MRICGSGLSRELWKGVGHQGSRFASIWVCLSGLFLANVQLGYLRRMVNFKHCAPFELSDTYTSGGGCRDFLVCGSWSRPDLEGSRDQGTQIDGDGRSPSRSRDLDGGDGFWSTRERFCLYAAGSSMEWTPVHLLIVRKLGFGSIGEMATPRLVVTRSVVRPYSLRSISVLYSSNPRRW